MNGVKRRSSSNLVDPLILPPLGQIAATTESINDQRRNKAFHDDIELHLTSVVSSLILAQAFHETTLDYRVGLRQ